ncbi:MAG: hypothetical protein J6K69_04960 [Candidatus Methanomethylophilaceae archaeon]|nr:hypothetical protein [Candidatus Methanomethylophilaceae archaeon]
MICFHCGFDDEGLNPFSKCLRCGRPFDLPDTDPTSDGSISSTDRE